MKDKIINAVRNVVADCLDATCPCEVIDDIARKTVAMLDKEDLLDLNALDDEGDFDNQNKADMDDDSNEDEYMFDEEESL